VVAALSALVSRVSLRLAKSKPAARGRPVGGSSESQVRVRPERRSDLNGSFRKEVIQPQVLLQLPCYDFTPITDHTVGAFPPFGSEQRLLVQPAFVM
jgi:hypothetical protein